MNVLLIGGGGREHALAWALRKSPKVETIWCRPGNAGIESAARGVSLDLQDRSAVLSFLLEKKIDLTVVGPEQPLVDGFADLVRESGGRVFGPSRAAARLEGSKVFAKNFMNTYGIPTADFKSFSRAQDAVDFVRSGQWNPSFRVVKADGLAGGKGVAVCAGRAAVLESLETVMVKKVFGSAGDQVVLEEALEGEELSVMALCDGEALSPLPPSQDHKRVFDGDQGPNTGGMGAYAPANFIGGFGQSPVLKEAPVSPVSDSLLQEIEKKIFQPFLRGVQKEGFGYCGAIYFGLMLTPGGPKVLEFNTRFGDPETQAVVPLIENDWFELFQATVDKRLKDVRLIKRSLSAVCVVMAARGYPGSHENGRPIRGLEDLQRRDDLLVFHAGTARGTSTAFQTNGGRVLGVTALAPDLESARRRAYEAVGRIHFDGAHFRKDIAAKALSRVT